MDVFNHDSAFKQLDRSDAQSITTNSAACQADTMLIPSGTEGPTPFDYPQEQQNIERWTTEIINACAALDFTNPVMQRLVPDFKSDPETIDGVSCQPISKTGYFAKHLLWVKKVPERTMTVLHVISDYNEDKGRAEVWVWLKLTGWGSGRFCAESVSCFKWKRSQGVWWCHQHTGLRGSPPTQGW